MARKGITFDQVANAAAAIKSRGVEPTITAIRKELGGEGSYSTISQHLAKWRAESADKIDAKDLPPEAEDAAMTAITAIWNIATKHAAKETAAVRQELTDTTTALKKELEEARDEIAKLEELRDLKEAELAKMREELKKSERHVAELEGAKGTLEKANQELIGQLKQQGPAKGTPGGDTKPERASAPAPSSGKKPA